jgi:hypothetical protein
MEILMPKASRSGNPAKAARTAGSREVPWSPFKRLDRLGTGETVWANSRYYVIVALGEGSVGWVGQEGTHDAHLSFRRIDRQPGPFAWRDLQRLKSELCGSEAEAVELFPAESRLVDGSNQRHLWVWRADNPDRPRVGWHNGREVADGGEILAKIQADPMLKAQVLLSGGSLRNLEKGVQQSFEDGADANLGHAGVIWP